MKCDFPYIIRLDKPIYNIVDGLFIDQVPVNCGKCLNCKKNRVNQWSFRLQQEHKRSYSAYFVTLTYDTVSIPITAKGFMTLMKTSKQQKDLNKQISVEPKEKPDLSLQAFFKRLRYYEEQVRKKETISLDQFTRRRKTTQQYFTDKKLRFYAAGEYGEVRKRPHYHIILFNLMDTKSIYNAWSFGSIHIGEVNPATINYCLKYIDKDQKSYLFPAYDGIKEFSIMSKRLGDNYINNDTKHYHKKPYNNFVTNERGVKVPLPKYYRENLLDKKDKNAAIIHISKEVKKQEDEDQRIAKKYQMHWESIQVKQKMNRQKIKEKREKNRTVD